MLHWSHNNPRWFFLGEIFSRGLPFLLLPVLTRALGGEEFGRLSVALASILFFTVLITWSLDAAVVRYAFVYGRKSQGAILAIVRIHIAVVCLLLITFCVLLDLMHYIHIICISAAASFVKTNYAYLQGQRRAYYFFLVQFIEASLITIFTLYLLLSLNGDHYYRLFAIFLGSVFALVAFRHITGSVSFKRKGVSFRTRYFYMISLSSPLLFASLVNFTKAQFDKIYLSNILSVSDLGIYSAGYQLASIASVISIATSRAVENKSYELIANNNNYLSVIDTIVSYGVFVLLVSGGVIYLLPESFYVLLLGNGFGGVGLSFTLFFLGFGLVFLNIGYTFVLIYHGRTKQLASISCVSVAFYLLALFWLGQVAPTYASSAMFFANILLLLGSRYSCSRYRK